MLEILFDLTRQYAELFFWLTVFSIVTVIIMMTLGVRVLARIPPDYFSNDERRRAAEFWHGYPPLARGLVVAGKNALGSVFVLAGIVLLVVPGQGLLTILAGVLLMDFPGKYDAERWLVRRRQVRRTIDWLRKRSGRPPLEID